MLFFIIAAEGLFLAVLRAFFLLGAALRFAVFLVVERLVVLLFVVVLFFAFLFFAIRFPPNFLLDFSNSHCHY